MDVNPPPRATELAAELDVALPPAAALGRPHQHHALVESTNTTLAAWARAGAPHGSLVTADAQSAGRGRLGRVWTSPPGLDVYASVLLRSGALTPAAGAPGWGALGLAVAVGVREGLERWAPDATLKWPNDVRVGGRKLAGILVESRWIGAEAEIVVGFGINVGRTRFPAELESIATSLAQLAAVAPSRAEVLAAVLVALESALVGFARGGFAALRERYVPYCEGLSGTVWLQREPEGAREPVEVVGLDDDGALRVRAPGRAPWRVQSADVWLRAEPDAGT